MLNKKIGLLLIFSLLTFSSILFKQNHTLMKKALFLELFLGLNQIFQILLNISNNPNP
jgi:hypothetical protein